MAQHRRVTKRAAQRAARRHQQVPRRRRVTAAVLAAGAAVSGASLAATTGTGTANAACASIWGVGNTANCISSLGNVAVVLDDSPNTIALADTGFFNFALASCDSGPCTGTVAQAGMSPLGFDVGNIAIIVGSVGAAGAGSTGGFYPQAGDFGVGIFNIAIVAFNGLDSNMTSNYAIASGLHNTSLILGSTGGGGRNAFSYGSLNHAAIIGSQSPQGGGAEQAAVVGILGTAGSLLGQLDPAYAWSNTSIGIFNHAWNTLGGASVQAGSFSGTDVLNFAVNAFGNGNVVSAQAPFLAIAGALGVDFLTVEQIGPGITINNSALPLPFARTAPPPALRTAAPGSDPAADGDGPVTTAASTAVNTVTTAVSTVNTAASQVNTAVSAAPDGDGPINTAVRQARAGDGPLASAVRQVRAGDGPLATAVRQVRAGDGPLATAVRQARAGDGPLASAVRQVRDTLGANE